MAHHYRKIAFIVWGMLVLLSPMAQAEGVPSWRVIAEGLEYKKLNLPLGGAETTLHVLKATPSKVSLKPVLSEKNTSAKNLAKKFGALAVVNANFFDEMGKVLGLVKLDQQTINPIKNISWWSVFCVRYNRASIIHTSKLKKGYCHQALQAGPRLVVDGAVPKLKDETSQKTAVGINGQGEVFIVVSEGEIPIGALALLMSKKEKDQGLGCIHALNLDGGSSTQMFINTERLTLNVPNFIKIPVGLGVFKK